MKQLDANSFEIEIPENATFKGLFDACHFIMVTPGINETHFPMSNLGQRKSILEICTLGVDVADEDLPLLLKYNRWRLTTIEEDLLFCAGIENTEDVYPLALSGPYWESGRGVKAYLTPEL